MTSGLLTGAMTRERAGKLPKSDWRSTHPDFTEPNLSRNLALAEENLAAFNSVVSINAVRVSTGDLAKVELSRSRLTTRNRALRIDDRESPAFSTLHF